jgi:hypothetical protein
MNKFIKKLLLKIIDTPQCGTPFIQMEREDKINKMMKGITSDLSEKDKNLLIKYHDAVSK